MKLARRLRYVPQLERTECGAAALAMVLDYHGNAVPLSEARAACAVSRDGVSAARIVSAATHFGLRARGLRLAAPALPRLRLPAILHWESNHFVVLEQLGKRDAVVVDPARGRRRISQRALSAAFSGVALVFERTPSTPERPHRSGSLRRYWSALARERSGLAFVAGCTLLLQLLALVGAASTQVVIDQAVGPGRARWLLAIGVVLALAALLRGALGWLRERVLINLQTALDVTLQSGFVRHLLQLPLAFFAQRAPGDLMQRVAESRELCSISRTLALSALDGLLVLAYGALMLAYDLRLGLAVLALGCGRVIAARLLRAPLRQATEQAIALGSRERATCIDTLSAMEMMRALAAESTLAARYRERAIERLNAELSLKRTEAALQACLSALDGAASALVLWLGGRAVLDERMTVGVLAGFLTLSRLLDAPLAALLCAFESYLRGQSTLARVDDVLASAPTARGHVVLSRARGEVAFQDVSFRHGPSSPWLFRNLSFRVRAGEKVALVGRSGAGKSTLLQLLLGALTPTSGTITIDGVPIDELDRRGLAQCLGAVLQEPFLLDDTVEHNLRLRVPDATHEALVSAAEIALVHEVILALPEGYRTRLGGDVQLSGGQRQRLALARALVGGPRLLLLDEATSSLDRATEAALHDNLGRLDCTRILVAHRLATVRDADRILVLENGQIAQQGSYRELAAAPGLLRELAESAA